MKIHKIIASLSIVLFISCTSTKKTIETTPKVAPLTVKEKPVVVQKSPSKTSKEKQQATVSTTEETKGNTTNTDLSNIEAIPYELYQIAEDLQDNIGVRYRSGGTNKNGFDCSGLIYTAFQKYAISLPRTSGEMAKTGWSISKEEARKGDLIFFRTNGRKTINHVGCVVENTDGEIKFIHASVSRGVIISSLNEGYYSNAFAKINRIVD